MQQPATSPTPPSPVQPPAAELAGSSSSIKQNKLQLDVGNGIAEEDIGEHDQSSPASDEDKMPEVAVAAASSGTNLNPDQDSSPNPEDGSSHRSRRRKKISFSETSKQWIWAQCSKHGYGDLVEG